MITLSLESLKNTALTRPKGYLGDVLSMAQIDGDKVTLTSEAYRELLSKYRKPGDELAPTSGPGTELKKLLRMIGIVAKPNCSCNTKARAMDVRGVEWCEANIDTIVGWLREEATKRKLPFVDMAGRLLVKRAIRNARRAVS
jgi:hypothetical protein